MENADLPLLRSLGQKMSYLSQRQTVLAENVANADTPKFKPSDLKPFEAASASAAHLSLAGTEGISLAPAKSGGFAAQMTKNNYEREPNGNGVVLEEQLMKVAQTQSDYALTTNLYKKQISLLKMALGHGG